MKITFQKLRLILLISLVFILSSFAKPDTSSKNNPKLKAYASASYSGIKYNEFLSNWLILGPVKITEDESKVSVEIQKEAFNLDYFTNVNAPINKPLAKIKIGKIEYLWHPQEAKNGIIDLGELLGNPRYSIAYALAEIKMDTAVTAMFGVGSDDAVKIFLNGVLVHSNCVSRGLNPDEDIVSLNLCKGNNQLLIKIQNVESGWGFTFRPLGKEKLVEKLVEFSGNGNLEKVKLLVENGIDLNATNSIGLSSYQHALVRGRQDVLDYLKTKEANTAVDDPSIERLTDAIFKGVGDKVEPGFAILASRNGEIIYEKAFGFGDVGNKVPLTIDSKFKIGSITKQFTAAAILKLQEEGKLNVEDKLDKYIPDFPRGKEVTIHHLLSHTSGIHSYTDRPNFLNYLGSPISSKALVDTIKAYPYDFNPGDQYKYNNSGYAILAYVIESASRKTYAEYLKDTFFKPLGMDNTGVYEAKKLLKHEAYGYSSDNGVLVKALNWDMSWASGAGALYSTVKDLFKWNEAVFNGKVLSEKSFKEAFTPNLLNNGKKTEYGFGWQFQNIRGLQFIVHDGVIHGYVSYIERQPENKVTVVVLCNSNPPSEGIYPGYSAQIIGEVMLWKVMLKQ